MLDLFEIRSHIRQSYGCTSKLFNTLVEEEIRANNLFNSTKKFPYSPMSTLATVKRSML